MITKKEFTDYMTDMYGEEDYSDLYKSFKTFSKITDNNQIAELRDLAKMNKLQRIRYRNAMASHGKELTPRQLDQYLSTIEYAILHIDENN